LVPEADIVLTFTVRRIGQSVSSAWEVTAMIGIDRIAGSA